MKFGNFSFKERTLFVDIILRFFSIVLPFVFILLFIVSSNNATIFHRFAYSDVKRETNFIYQDLKSRFSSLEAFVEQGNFAVRNLEEVKQLQGDVLWMLCEVVAKFPYVSSVGLGLQEGSFYLMRSYDPVQDKETKKGKSVPKKCRFILYIIDQDSKMDRYIYLSETLELLSEEDFEINKNFLVKERGWYKKAIETQSGVWSSVYVGSLSGKNMVTYSSPIDTFKERKIFGVLSVDVPLENFSYLFSSTQKKQVVDMGKENEEFSFKKRAMMVGQNGEVLFTSDGNLKRKLLGNQLPTVWDYDDPIFSDVYKKIQKGKEDVFNIYSENERYLVGASQFNGSSYLDGWTAVVLYRQKDILAQYSQGQNIFFVTLILMTFFLFIMIVRISNIVTRPIRSLSLQAEYLRNMDFEKIVECSSHVKEMKELHAVLLNMRNNLINFEKFIPKMVVRSINESGKEVTLGGSVQSLTIFFSDIANFTSISEEFEPEKMFLHLSEYFDELTKTIIGENGTIDKYIGDSIMAFWGAPKVDPDQMIHACSSALLCQKKLKELERKWDFESKPSLVTRMGIHSGNVIVGNVGSNDRINYTIIGDSVNLASRLEGLNKVYGTLILISETTYKGIRDVAAVRPLDVVAVKGKKIGVRIYELMGLRTNRSEILPSRSTEEKITSFTRGYDLYLLKDWDEALKSFQETLLQFPDDKATQIYIQRCQFFLNTPPKEDWDGVFHMTQK